MEGEQPLHLVGEHITVHNEAAVFEVQPPLGLNDPDSPPESVVEGPVTELREELGQQKTSHPSGCNSREDGTTLPDLMLPSDEIVGVIVVESEDTPVESVKIQAPAAQPLSLPVTIVNGSTDLSMIAEGEEENSSLAKNIGKGNSQSSLQALDGGVPAEVMELAPTSEPVTKPESDAVSAIVAVGGLISAPSIGVTASGPVNTSATIPVRQVRSSWLSKALGTGTVPISGLPGTTSDREALRKSSAASSQRPNGPVDLAALRKSLAPAGALKRKSDAGMDEDEEEERRPDKMAKVHSVIPSTVNPLSDSQTQSTIVVPMSNRAPASTTSLPHTNPSPKLPEALMTLQHPRSDIHKVTKALDELRERAQAKELAKQRSAPKATSTGSGFLRGLGNLGRSLGLGNSVKTAEEEAVRLEEERRAEIEAQEELARLIGEVSKPVQPVETGSETDAPLSAALLGPAQQDEVEDEVEVDELEEEVEYHASSEPLFMDVQPPQPDRPITPPQIDSEAVTSTTPADVPPRISTTPAGTPRQAWPPVYPAPVLHAQVEKHLHLSPAKVPKPSSEEPEHSVVAMLSPVHRPAAIIEQKPDQVDGRTSVSRSVTDRLSDTEDEAMEEEEENTEVEAKPVSEAVVNRFRLLSAELTLPPRPKSTCNPFHPRVAWFRPTRLLHRHLPRRPVTVFSTRLRSSQARAWASNLRRVR